MKEYEKEAYMAEDWWLSVVGSDAVRPCSGGPDAGLEVSPNGRRTGGYDTGI